MSREVLEALLAARVVPALAELQAYVPDQETVPVRLDANEAPALLPTLSVEERALWDRTLSEVEPARYPDVRARALRRAIAHRGGVDPEGLVIGCGSDEVIAILLAALARPVSGPPKIVIPSPTFVMYRISARVHGYEVCEVPLDARWDLDRPAMLAALERERPAVVFLATPNNPTSGAYAYESVAAIAEAAARIDPPSLVVVDEAYLAFRQAGADPWAGRTGLELLARHANVVVLRTLSKIGLAALRVGYAVAHPLLARELEKARLPYDLPAHSQVAATLALGALAPAIDRHVAAIGRERARVVAALQSRSGVECDAERTHANFAWVRADGAADLAAGLKQKGVLVRTFKAYPDRFRVSFGSEVENARFLAALGELR